MYPVFKYFCERGFEMKEKGIEFVIHLWRRRVSRFGWKEWKVGMVRRNESGVVSSYRKGRRAAIITAFY